MVGMGVEGGVRRMEVDGLKDRSCRHGRRQACSRYQKASLEEDW